MTSFTRGAVAGGIQLVLMLSIAGKYTIDRSSLPRVWVRVTPYDPQLPVRGRYVRLQVHTVLRGSTPGKEVLFGSAALSIENGQLIATTTDADTGVQVNRVQDDSAILTEPIAFFIPEHIPDPSRRPAGEELWPEVSIPGHGPPRPVRLGVRRGETIVPLDLN